MKIDTSLKLGSTLFLKLVILLIGIVVLALCTVALPMGLRIKSLELYHPFLISLYIPAIPFFVALFQAYKLLGYIEQNQIFTSISVKALRSIKNCAVAISALFFMGMPYIFHVGDTDNTPEIILVSYVIIFASVVIATFAGVMQKLVQSATDIKSENDLTV